jgi:dTDP-glucose 4,6-dehydratase
MSLKLLVTGGLGFIGSNFIKYYLQKYPEDAITNLDKKTYASNPIASEELKKLRNYKLVVGDICDSRLVLELSKDVDAIVHFAAETHVDRAIKNPSEFVTSNIVGTFVLLEAARANNVKRFHHISTDEVFGSLDLDSKEKFSESTFTCTPTTKHMV